MITLPKQQAFWLSDFLRFWNSDILAFLLSGFLTFWFYYFLTFGLSANLDRLCETKNKDQTIIILMIIMIILITLFILISWSPYQRSKPSDFLRFWNSDNLTFWLSGFLTFWFSDFLTFGHSANLNRLCETKNEDQTIIILMLIKFILNILFILIMITLPKQQSRATHQGQHEVRQQFLFGRLFHPLHSLALLHSFRILNISILIFGKILKFWQLLKFWRNSKRNGQSPVSVSLEFLAW